jgi:hypothetical protein
MDIPLFSGLAFPPDNEQKGRQQLAITKGSAKTALPWIKKREERQTSLLFQKHGLSTGS